MQASETAEAQLRILTTVIFVALTLMTFPAMQ